MIIIKYNFWNIVFFYLGIYVNVWSFFVFFYKIVDKFVCFDWVLIVGISFSFDCVSDLIVFWNFVIMKLFWVFCLKGGGYIGLMLIIFLLVISLVLKIFWYSVESYLVIWGVVKFNNVEFVYFGIKCG